MKKILFFAIAMVALNFATSCGSSATNSSNDVDSVKTDTASVDSASVADSVNVDSTAFSK